MDLEDKLKIEHERKKRTEDAESKAHKVDLELHDVGEDIPCVTQALYVNGVLYRQDSYEGHIVADFLENCTEYPLLINSFKFVAHDSGEPVYERLAEKGTFPETLEQLYNL